MKLTKLTCKDCRLDLERSDLRAKIQELAFDCMKGTCREGVITLDGVKHVFKVQDDEVIIQPAMLN
jgi:hypothetical protein